MFELMVEGTYPGEVLKTSMDTFLGSVGIAAHYPFFFLHYDLPSGTFGSCSTTGFAFKG